MRNCGLLSSLTAAALIVAAIACLITENGWFLAIPIVLAVIVVGSLTRHIG